MKLRIATRGSALARWQADHVAAALRQCHPGIDIGIVVLTTTGDRFSQAALSGIGEVGLFTREVDSAVLDGRADLAVHSLKDVPTTPPDGIRVEALPARHDPRDAFVPAPGRGPTLDALPAGARVGTSSLRRRALLLAARPDLEIVNLRGNIDTRLARVERGEIDGTVLALAGLERLDLSAKVGEVLEPPDWLPAAGQGALAVSIREDDEPTGRAVRAIDHAPTRTAVTAERALLRTLMGGCQVPIGALATVSSERVALHGFVASLDGATLCRGRTEGPAERAEQLGEDLADALRRAGGEAILRNARAALESSP